MVISWSGLSSMTRTIHKLFKNIKWINIIFMMMMTLIPSFIILLKILLMPNLVINISLLLVREAGKSSRHFFKGISGFWMRIFIRMKFKGKFSVWLFNIPFFCCFWDVKNLVVVFLWQNSLHYCFIVRSKLSSVFWFFRSLSHISSLARLALISSVVHIKFANL